MSLADTSHVATSVPNDLESLWLPFTPNRAFKKAPRLGRTAYEAMEKAFADKDLMIRIAGDTIALSPPLIITESGIGEMFVKLARVLEGLA